MKSILDVLKEVTDHFQTLGIEYMVVGSVGSMVYGRTRSTLDIDLVVKIKSSSVGAFCKKFEQPEYYCPPLEILDDEVARQGLFNLVHISSGIKVDIILVKDTDFYRSEFSRKRKIEFLPGLSFFVASPEDIIIKKLDYYREGGSGKHLEDIRAMLISTTIEIEYIEEWISILGLTTQWNAVK